jgi:hypothetical protein
MASCAGPTPCGGDLVGTWKYSGYCQDVVIPQQALNLCSTLTATATGTLVGTTVFTGGAVKTVTRNAVNVINAVITVPASCTQGGLLSCSAIATLISNQIPGATCTGGVLGSGCTCFATIVQTTNDSAPYSTANGVLTISGSTTQTYNYCVTTISGGATQLQYLETTPNPRETGTGTLIKQ